MKPPNLHLSSGGDMTAIAPDALHAAATGGSFDIGARDETWDGGAAEKSYDLPGDSDCYMWKNPDGDPSAKSSYKLPFVSKSGGKHAVWGAITAIAAALNGGRGGVQGIPAADRAKIKSKVSGYYTAAKTKYDDDAIKAPFAADIDALRAFLAAHDADFLDEDELRAYMLIGRFLAMPLAPIDVSSKVLEAADLGIDEWAILAASTGGTPWQATLCVAGTPTVDSGMKRLLMVGGGSWLPLPLPLGLLDDTPHADVTTKSPVVGRIDQIWFAGNVVQGAGVFFDNSADPSLAEQASKAAALVTEMQRMGISVDLANTEVQAMLWNGSSVTDPYVVPVEEAVPATEANLPNDMPTADEDEGEGEGESDEDLEYINVFTQWVIAGAH